MYDIAIVTYRHSSICIAGIPSFSEKATVDHGLQAGKKPDLGKEQGESTRSFGTEELP